MKKMLLILLTALLMMMTSACKKDAGQTIHTSGDWQYVRQEDGTAEIVRYTGSAEKLTVPAKLGMRKVTSIGDTAFTGRFSLTSIELPDSVTSIGNNAFTGCFYLTSITLPDSVTSIGANPFMNCFDLTDIIVSPEHPTLEVIDGVLFDKAEKRLICYPRAYKASSYTVPQGTRSIGDYAFAVCESLTGITLPDTVTSIGESAFGGCESLASITLPDSLTSIGANPFSRCNELTDIIVSPEHPTLEMVDGVLFDKVEKRLICYPCAKTASSYAVPQGTRSIAISAFNDCTSLTSITLPDTVTSIGRNAFFGCKSLTSITLPDSVTSIGVAAFHSCSSLTTLTLPATLTTIGDHAFDSCPNLTLTIPRDTWLTDWCEEAGLRYTFAD